MRNEYSLKKLAFSLVVIGFLCIRLIATIVYPLFPAWDPWSYYWTLNTILTDRLNPLYNKSAYYTSGITYVLASVVEASGVSGFDAVKWLSPFIYTLILIPILFIMSREFGGSYKAGLIALLLFGVSDIGVLRESYTIAEGLALPLSIVAVYAAIKYYEKGDKYNFFTLLLLLLSLPFIHHLTSFIMYFTFAVALTALIKFRKYKRNLALTLTLVAASLLVFSSQAHVYMEYQTYTRLLIFLKGLGKARPPLSIYEAMTEKYAAVPTSYTEFFFHHLSTIGILILAFIAFIELLTKKIKKPGEMFHYVWLIITVAFFLASVLGDYFFGWLFEFYGFRAWIFAAVPASIFAARILDKISRKTVLILPLIIALFTLGTCTFIVYQFDTMNIYQYEIDTSDWIINNIGNRTLITSPASFRASISIVKLPYVVDVESEDYEFFACNMSHIERVLNSQEFNNIYVMSSKRANEKPFHTAYLRVCYDVFHEEDFSRIYDSGLAWVWKYNKVVLPVEEEIKKQDRG